MNALDAKEPYIALKAACTFIVWNVLGLCPFFSGKNGVNYTRW
jgi:hypothetical protein